MPRKHFVAAMMLTTCWPAALHAASETVDGTQPLLCATIETIECIARADCRYGTADSLGFPQFLRIDLAGKRITADRPDGTRLDAAVANIAEFDDRFVLQGVENHLGWTVTIDRSNARMSAAVAGRQITFMVFGACTAQ